MTITIDQTALLRSIDALPARVKTGILGGLSDAAKVGEEIMQTSPLHGDQSGAAHASYFVGVIGANAQQRADEAYQAAASLLTGFTGHAGKAERIAVDEGGIGLVFGSPVDYAGALADEGRSPVRGTRDEMQELALRLAAEGVHAELVK